MQQQYYKGLGLRSFLMNQEAIRMIEEKPELVTKALDILEHWREISSTGLAEKYIEWKDIIQNKRWDMVLEESETGIQRRQGSPLPCILPESTRFEILREVNYYREEPKRLERRH